MVVMMRYICYQLIVSQIKKKKKKKKNGGHTADDIAKLIFVIVAMKLWLKFQGVLPVLTMVQMLMGQHWFRQQPGTG